MTPTTLDRPATSLGTAPAAPRRARYALPAPDDYARSDDFPAFPPADAPPAGLDYDAGVPALRPRGSRLERSAASERRRFWLLDRRRREEAFSSEAACLFSIAVIIPLSGVAAYFYAMWTIGPT